MIGEHDRDEDGSVRQGGLELVGIDAAVPVDRQFHDLEAELLQVPDGVPNVVVLDRRRDYAVAPRLPRPG
ncbi:MAG: hypothetical protein WD079_02445, partial [Phycisphaeraceae bacterium]